MTTLIAGGGGGSPSYNNRLDWNTSTSAPPGKLKRGDDLEPCWNTLELLGLESRSSQSAALPLVDSPAVMSDRVIGITSSPNMAPRGGYKER